MTGQDFTSYGEVEGSFITNTGCLKLHLVNKCLKGEIDVNQFYLVWLLSSREQKELCQVNEEGKPIITLTLKDAHRIEFTNGLIKTELLTRFAVFW